MSKKRGNVPVKPGDRPGSSTTGKGSDDHDSVSQEWLRHWDVTMTSTMTMAHPVDVETFDPASMRKLTRSDLAAFDKDSTNLALEMQEHGWRGYVTSRGHVMMRHPDGSTQSLTRSSNRAKSGVAMRSRFMSWQRRNEERRAAAAESAFGQIPDQPRDMEGLPIATLADIKRHPVIGPLMVAEPDLPDSRMVLDDDRPKAWGLFRVDGPYPVLLGIGSHATEEWAWELLLREYPDVFPAPAQVSESQDEAGEQDMATVFKCPQCDATFESHAKARSHETHKHHATAASCPDCGKEFKNRGAVNLHWGRAHDKTEYTCPNEDCDRVFIGKGPLNQHIKKSHPVVPALVPEAAGDVTVAGHPVVTPAVDGVTAPDVTVTSPEPPTSSAAHDVVMEHLEHLPEGDDAEELVAAVRAIVAAPLVHEIRRLREDNERLEGEYKIVAARNVELEAKLSIMREAMSL